MTDVMQDAVRVKPLEWEDGKAVSPFCDYMISPVHDDTGPHWQTSIRYRGSTYKRSETEEEAISGAQADYEPRIRSALLPPVPVNSYEEMRAALEAYDAGMHHIGSCGDGGCLIERPKGQHTNGGCQCSHNKSRAQRAMQRGRMLADAVRAALDGKSAP